ncbi:MAG: hypothetical protein IC227_11480 [Enterococcus lacertideformus]|uniref:Uncharacterized protein n=1 Tax=Enterococcus lacertideformus TaxID=2771493 RepID=A0A931FDD7_9ENTE|nr:hypothetical protein [Enterococcus lacertideformus]
MKKKLITGMLIGATLASFIFPTGLEVALADEMSESVHIIKNDKMLGLEKELNSPQVKLALHSKTTDQQAMFDYFAKKYDGAQITYVGGRATGVSETFYVGGYNVFASNQSALNYCRTQLATTATLLQANGTLGGALLGGPAGALIGLLGATILAGRFRDGSSTMKSWINVGSSKGGSRMTLTEEFPIATLNTTYQSPIKPL